MPSSVLAIRTTGRRSLLAALLILPVLASVLWNQPAPAQEAPVEIPPPTTDLAEPGTTATAIFAGGCFWGVQGVFQHVNGVTRAVSGYSGGAAETATYEQTGSGNTGHAEAVEVTYDPSVVSYGKLLQVYFSVGHITNKLG